MISRATPGVPGDLQGTFAFGVQTLPGDLDGDSYTDLLVTSGGDEGEPTVLWGSKDGLTGQNTVLPTGTPSSPSVTSTATASATSS